MILEKVPGVVTATFNLSLGWHISHIAYGGTLYRVDDFVRALTEKGVNLDGDDTMNVEVSRFLGK